MNYWAESEGVDDDEIPEIPIINVRSPTLAKVVEFLNAYQLQSMDEIQRVWCLMCIQALNTNNMSFNYYQIACV